LAIEELAITAISRKYVVRSFTGLIKLNIRMCTNITDKPKIEEIKQLFPFSTNAILSPNNAIYKKQIKTENVKDSTSQKICDQEKLVFHSY